MRKNTVIHLEDGQFDLWNSLNGAPFQEAHAECHPSETKRQTGDSFSFLLMYTSSGQSVSHVMLCDAMFSGGKWHSPGTL